MEIRETTFDIAVDSSGAAMERVLDHGAGVLRLAPAWVPRAFCTPGRRLRLHPDDYYPFQKGRGGIDERWLGSTVRADNGVGTGPYEGLSLAVDPSGALVPLDEFVDTYKGKAIGDRMWNDHGGWAAYSKFYDNLLPLPFHMHPMDEHAALIGKKGKPEAYYYVPQMNNYLGDQPITYLGLQPETTKEQLLERLMRHERGGDNHISDYSLGYRTRVGEGWDMPAGILHAPASICTYEPQRASDVLSMFESWSNNMEVGWDLLWKDVPPEHHGDYAYLIEMLDWEKNVDSNFHEDRALVPFETEPSKAQADGRYVEKWIVYKSAEFSAKELTVFPGQSARLVEQDAYGLIVTQGHGTINGQPLETITMVRISEMTHDEYFVTAEAARGGVTITNSSPSENLVVLKHYGPGNEELGL